MGYALISVLYSIFDSLKSIDFLVGSSMVYIPVVSPYLSFLYFPIQRFSLIFSNLSSISWSNLASLLCFSRGSSLSSYKFLPEPHVFVLRGPDDWLDWVSWAVVYLIDLDEIERVGDLSFLDEIFDLLRGGG